MVVRRSVITTLTASRCSHEPKALSPRNERSLSQARTNYVLGALFGRTRVAGQAQAQGVHASASWW